MREAGLELSLIILDVSCPSVRRALEMAATLSPHRPPVHLPQGLHFIDEALPSGLGAHLAALAVEVSPKDSRSSGPFRFLSTSSRAPSPEDPAVGSIGGNVNITGALDESDIDSYSVYFVSITGCPHEPPNSAL